MEVSTTTPKIDFNAPLDAAGSQDLHGKAAEIFQPAAPISTMELFAGRWEQVSRVTDAVRQKGRHVIVFGERGVGKTSLANVIRPMFSEFVQEGKEVTLKYTRLTVKINVNKADTFATAWKRIFDEVRWLENKPMLGFGTGSDYMQSKTLSQVMALPDAPTIDEIRTCVSKLPGSVFIFDEFDRMRIENRSLFTDLIKLLSDYGIDTTVILVGVSDTVDELIADHASIGRAVIQVAMPRMNYQEMFDLLDKASHALGVNFTEEAKRLIASTAQGLPHYVHLLGLHSVRDSAAKFTRSIGVENIVAAFQKATDDALQTIRSDHLRAVHSARKDALYAQVAAACALASSSIPDELGYFHAADVTSPLQSILRRPKLKIATFQKHVTDFCEASRGPLLERAGAPRAYKYRFCNPLMPSYILMQAMACEMLNTDQLVALVKPK